MSAKRLLFSIIVMITSAISVCPEVLGDVTNDGFVDISDINTIINVMLGKDSHEKCDVNNDGLVDISDINFTINLMLGKDISIPAPHGLYLGIIGFNDELYQKDFSLLDRFSISSYADFITNLDNEPRATILFYAVDNALEDIKKAPRPDNLGNVTIITFTDGLDVGSARKSNWKYENSTQYADAIHEQIMSQQINGVSIDAYAIGLVGNDVNDIEQFNYELNSLVNDSNNIFLASNIDQMKNAFEQVSSQIIRKNTSSDLSIKTYGPDNGMKLRYTLTELDNDNIDSANAYIEATFRSNGDIFDNIEYNGLTTKCGNTVYPTKVDDNGYLYYDFKGIKLISGSELDPSLIKEWRWNSRTNSWWQNSEFSAYDIQVNSSEISAICMLLLDCSYSLGSYGFSTLKNTSSKFVRELSQAFDPLGNRVSVKYEIDFSEDLLQVADVDIVSIDDDCAISIERLEEGNTHWEHQVSTGFNGNNSVDMGFKIIYTLKSEELTKDNYTLRTEAKIQASVPSCSRTFIETLIDTNVKKNKVAETIAKYNNKAFGISVYKSGSIEENTSFTVPI